MMFNKREAQDMKMFTVPVHLESVSEEKFKELIHWARDNCSYCTHNERSISEFIFSLSSFNREYNDNNGYSIPEEIQSAIEQCIELSPERAKFNLIMIYFRH